MARGKVKWFNVAKGFGFIQPEDGGADIFVHITAVQRSGLHALSSEQVIEYEIEMGSNGKLIARNLKV